MPLPPPPTSPPVLSFHRPSASELVPSLRLLSDSIAQYRPLQNYSFFSHPLFLAGYGALMAVLLTFNWHKPLGTLLLLLCGVTAGIFTLVAKTTIEFLSKAEELGSNEGLEKLKGKECIIASWRDDVVGVIAWEESDTSSIPKEDEELDEENLDGEEGISKPRKVYVRIWGWTVRRKERGRGLGGDLIKIMIQEVRSKYSSVPDGKTNNRNIKFEFDIGNIHSVRVLPEKYNWALDRNKVWSKKVLKRYSKMKDLQAPALES